jgi:signal transduction histidine kinase
MTGLPITTVVIAHEKDVVTARRRARQIARLLKFPDQDGTRIGTAVSEIARNAYAYGQGGKVEFLIGGAEPQSLEIRIADRGPGIADVDAILSGRYQSSTGMGMGIVGARRLMDDFQMTSAPGKGTQITLRKHLPAGCPAVTPKSLAAIAAQLAQEPQDIYDEIRYQNQELLNTLEDVRRRDEDLSRMNRELEDTNRGVVALYAELDQRAEQLGHADRMKSRFLSHMSHEFRTPLNAIVGLTRLLLKRGAVTESAEVAREVAFIQQTALSLTEMVDDLLDLSKAESGKLTVQAAEMDVTALFGTLRAMLRPLAVNSAVELIFEEPSGIPAMIGDESKISQILRNLLSNALKFTERGEVRASVRYLAEKDLVSFCVADTGIGIAPEHREHIFEEFAQIENRLQNRVKGTGLGLPLCRKLAELLGGSVQVESAPGAGSRFTVLLPRCYRTAVDAEPDDRARTVLLIDDAEVSRYLLRQLLGQGFRLAEAMTGSEGIELAGRLRPDLILLDLNMPGMSGFEVLDRLKAAAETRDIPVVVVTGQNLDTGERERLARQTVAILHKEMMTGTEALSIDFGPPFSVEPRYAGRTQARN